MLNVFLSIDGYFKLVNVIAVLILINARKTNVDNITD